jgi:hypothetical protein
MTAHDRLRVQATDELVLDAGTCEAVTYLPMASKAPRLKGGPFAALADPETGARLVGASDPTPSATRAACSPTLS